MSLMQVPALSPRNVYGAVPTDPGLTSAPATASIAGPSADDSIKPWHTDSPLFWFGVLALATVGLIAGSTAVRVGPAHASLRLGKDA